MPALSPVPKLQFFADDGSFLAGGKLYTYAAGTSTPLATKDEAGANNTNPVVLDSRGEASVRTSDASYKFVLKTSADVTVWTIDNIDGRTPDSVVSALTTALAASSGSGTVGFIASGASAVARTVQSKLRDSVSVFDFMTTAEIADVQARTTTLNVTAAIQAAIDAVGGGAVYFPPGTYKITGTLAMTVAGGHVGTMLVGSGVESSILYFDNGSSDCITVTGTDTGASQFNGFTMRDFSITHGTKTGGRTFVISFAYKVLLETLYIGNCWCGIEGYVINNLNLYDINIQGVSGGGNNPAYLGPVEQAPLNCYGVFWHAPSDGSFRSDALRTINVTVQASFSGADGFLWDGAATTWDAYQTTALSCAYGFRIRNTGASASNYPVYGEFHNCNTDGAMNCGVRIEGGALMHFNSCNLTNTSGSSGQGNADTYAVEILPDETASFTRGLKFVNSWFGNCREDAMYCNARDVQLTGCTFNDGGKAASNTYSGLTIGSDAEDIIVNGCSFSQYGANNQWKYGITVSSGSVRVLVNANYIFNSQTKPINWLCTDSSSRCYNNVSENRLYLDTMPFNNPASISLAVSNQTMTAAQTMGGVVLATGAGATRDLTTATAAQLVAALQNPMLGVSWQLQVINTGSATVSIAGGSGITMSGNTATSKFDVAAGASRLVTFRVTNLGSGTEAVTAYS